MAFSTSRQLFMIFALCVWISNSEYSTKLYTKAQSVRNSPKLNAKRLSSQTSPKGNGVQLAAKQQFQDGESLMMLSKAENIDVTQSLEQEASRIKAYLQNASSTLHGAELAVKTLEHEVDEQKARISNVSGAPSQAQDAREHSQRRGNTQVLAAADEGAARTEKKAAVSLASAGAARPIHQDAAAVAAIVFFGGTIIIVAIGLVAFRSYQRAAMEENLHLSRTLLDHELDYAAI